MNQRVWLNNVAEGVLKVGEWKGPKDELEGWKMFFS
ncbi:hypothetical protein FOXG_22432 [Fusarium oxysporum f. sp. lycopersici 4287]|uniref:Uncharacterized protein n=1 Tax=Fusarium oxysporum f. sp. lycopersici (strain 4287 / CBS 123668 / FGSC 9935 / NRRL 34936) TaxID=426428 RepID=A0A0J9V661_FUSO4|nr:hypothetical protein FOXG_19275 [Fusarium oxysporum f. sp. lycopersici 4287]XP_018242771.1 hypothetical protein FOXG_19383 [Fusarium oxysporum f. sp. lycopersici 4287]XP_018244698.1 hypothetical protein FOXG_19747 [Fusarium oxysporum f. sp. lycopersici 4287]XP_018256997.1 uncharacterized protein FOXG_22432 [Fusarium oxysporum f. sp. lycopersici 4287]KNB04363.1 hypothetical protein FOXG_19275 [Fusarium oxysporum f. sp. lycopersici 4287]KNB04726.1 hypothetical protein FOXG_19383 [Fusarium oxy